MLLLYIGHAMKQSVNYCLVQAESHFIHDFSLYIFHAQWSEFGFYNSNLQKKIKFISIADAISWMGSFKNFLQTNHCYLLQIPGYKYQIIE